MPFVAAFSCCALAAFTAHPRFHMYLTPASSSWLNVVERFFRDITEQQLRRGIFRDVEELIMPNGDRIDKHKRAD